MQKLRKILDYFGISFTLATRTASNPIPIVKEHKVTYTLFGANVQKQHPRRFSGWPYIPGLNAEVLRLDRIKGIDWISGKPPLSDIF